MRDVVETQSWSVDAAHDERRDAILKAAADILRQKGLSSLTMQSIADRLGVTKGSLYYYYKNKQEMLFACHMRASEDVLRLLDEAQALDGPPSVQLHHILAGLVCSVVDDPYGAILVADLEALDPNQRRSYVAVRDRYEERVRDLIRQGIAAQEFAPTDAKIAGFVLLGAVNWISKWYNPTGPSDPKTIAKVFADTLVRGLRP